MSYTYDLSTDIGKLRLEIPDVSPTGGVSIDYIFKDEELQHFLNKKPGNIQWAKAYVYENLCAVSANDGGKQIEVGDIEIRNNSNVGQNWCNLARDLRKKLEDGLAPEGSLALYTHVGGIYQADRDTWEQNIADGVLTDRDFWKNYNSIKDTSHINGESDCE